jgi:hypothetical protein
MDTATVGTMGAGLGFLLPYVSYRQLFAKRLHSLHPLAQRLPFEGREIIQAGTKNVCM